jgi:hypothetical protein
MAEPRERVHPAARGFDSGAEAYERGRPDYPSAALAHLATGLHLGPGVELLELASGTGKLTRGLLPFGVRVVAVEPSPGMRETFRRTVPGVDVLDGTAEAIPRPMRSSSVKPSTGSVRTLRCGRSVASSGRRAGSASCGTAGTNRFRGSPDSVAS